MSAFSKDGPWGDLIIKRGHTTFSASENQTYTTEPTVSEIVASNGVRVVFSANEERRDLRTDEKGSEAKALSEIKIYAPSGNLLRRWVFEYDYFKSYIEHPTDTFSNLRLKLKSMKEYGSSQSTGPCVYLFSYYGEEMGEPQMPFRGSFSGHDYWGYCNGMTTDAKAISFYESFPWYAGYV
ncbi:hypothetical protein NXX53_24400 [Bacteroides salyersiae]|nr:hypothetical protein [Bacteroides salyersiae]